MSENLTRVVRRMAMDGSEPAAIAIALDCELRTVQGLIWRMRQRRDLPPPPRIDPHALPGQMLVLLEHYAPQPVSGQAIRRSLGCGLAAFRRALDRLVDIGAARAGDDGLVTLRSVVAVPEVEPAPVPAQPVIRIELPTMRARVLHAAVLRRAFALVRCEDRSGAVTLLNRAAERSAGDVATNFLVIGDLIGAGHERYPEISEADAERLRIEAGFLAGVEVRAALASEASA
jgi:hypothetical protein